MWPGWKLGGAVQRTAQWWLQGGGNCVKSSRRSLQVGKGEGGNITTANSQLWWQQWQKYDDGKIREDTPGNAS